MDIAVSQSEREIFTTALRHLNTAKVPFVVAGAFCVHYYTGIWRGTKDMDVFTLSDQAPRILKLLDAAGFSTWVEAEHWLGKATKDSCLVDVIFGSGNWVMPIDTIWFERSKNTILFGEPVQMAPIEEMIWTKSYIGGRERYDAPDVCHLLLASEGNIDWQHLLWRFGNHWQLLLANLVLFGFIYPSKQDLLPRSVMDHLLGKLVDKRQRKPAKDICLGTLLDRFSFNYDVEHLGFVDARELYARRRGSPAGSVAAERAWAKDKLAKGEVYKAA